MSFYSLPSSSSIWLSVKGSRLLPGRLPDRRRSPKKTPLDQGLVEFFEAFVSEKKPYAVIIDKIVEKRKSDPDMAPPVTLPSSHAALATF